MGRFSNGPTWAELLPAEISLTENPDNNFAFGGARSDGLNVNGGGLPGLQTEVSSYLSASPFADQTALYIVWAGANDYLGGGVTDVNQVVGNLSTAVTNLANANARYFLVPNLPNLGDTPGGAASGDPMGLNTLTGAHNAALSAEMANLETTLGVDITILDVNTLFADILANPGMFGFTDVTTPCFVTPNPPCATPDSSLFWDAIHPTAAAHQILAQEAALVLPTPTAVENWTLYE
jgi:phospholipase/lecithinase/hemolysin